MSLDFVAFDLFLLSCCLDVYKSRIPSKYPPNLSNPSTYFPCGFSLRRPSMALFLQILRTWPCVISSCFVPKSLYSSYRLGSSLVIWLLRFAHKWLPLKGGCYALVRVVCCVCRWTTPGHRSLRCPKARIAVAIIVGEHSCFARIVLAAVCACDLLRPSRQHALYLFGFPLFFAV